MIRRFIIRIVAWCLRDSRRHGHARLTLEEIESAMIKAFPNHDAQWRDEIFYEARMLNYRKGHVQV